MVFYVYNRPDQEGFHEIKNESGSIIATAADTGEQTRITLEVMGYTSFYTETVYSPECWAAIGSKDAQ